jgi:hypothetical protein
VRTAFACDLFTFRRLTNHCVCAFACARQHSFGLMGLIEEARQSGTIGTCQHKTDSTQCPWRGRPGTCSSRSCRACSPEEGQRSQGRSRPRRGQQPCPHHCRAQRASREGRQRRPRHCKQHRVTTRMEPAGLDDSPMGDGRASSKGHPLGNGRTNSTEESTATASGRRGRG